MVLLEAFMEAHVSTSKLTLAEVCPNTVNGFIRCVVFVSTWGGNPTSMTRGDILFEAQFLERLGHGIMSNIAICVHSYDHSLIGVRPFFDGQCEILDKGFNGGGVSPLGLEIAAVLGKNCQVAQVNTWKISGNKAGGACAFSADELTNPSAETRGVLLG